MPEPELMARRVVHRVTRWSLVALLVVAAVVGAGAQTSRGRTPAKKPAPKPPALKFGPVEMKCPAVLGTGVRTKRLFCDVMSGIRHDEGVLIAIPARTGPATLTFDLHNRHTYSESEVKSGRAFARYTATVVLANFPAKGDRKPAAGRKPPASPEEPSGEVLGRATVHNEFRTAADLFDRVTGGAGPGGVKAVAPTGVETIVFTVPEDVTEVVVLGERLMVQRAIGREVFTSAGRPMAIVSNPTLEYRPKPPARSTTRRR
jgi:hypothetical protein